MYYSSESLLLISSAVVCHSVLCEMHQVQSDSVVLGCLFCLVHFEGVALLLQHS